jgi:hypothetical protein
MDIDRTIPRATATEDQNEGFKVKPKISHELSEPIVESEPKAKEYFLPSIDQYPNKERKKIQQAHAQAQSALSLATIQDTRLLRCENIVSKAASDGTQKEEQQSEDKEKIDAKIENIDREFALLQQVYRKLQRGEDVYKLLSQQPFYINPEDQYDRFDVRVSVEDHKKYGKPHNLLDLARKAFLARRTEYQTEKRKYYSDNLRRAFNSRLERFYQVVATLPIAEDWSSANFRYKTRELEAAFSEGEAVYSMLEENLTDFQHALGTETRNVDIHQSYKTKIDRWRSRHQQELEEIKPLNEWEEKNGNEALRYELEISDRQLEEKIRRLSQLQSYPDAIRKTLVHATVQELQKHIKSFRDAYSISHVGDGDFGFLVNSSTIPAEAAKLQKHFVALVSQMESQVKATNDADNSKDREWLAARLEECKILLSDFQQRMDNAAKTNKEFPSSPDLLWHVGNFEMFTKNLLGSGTLASRAYQLEHFGEATFYSAGILRMTKDTITVRGYKDRPETMTWEQYEEKNRNSGTAKDPYQEAHQLCFTRNYPYMYADGIAFLFSAASLFSKSQFMSEDGFHLFDAEFKTGRKDSPGFHIDLHNEQFAIAVTEERKTEFLQYVREEMVNSEAWKNTIVDLEAWINDHVIFVDNLQNSNDINARARELLRKQGQTQVQEGYFLPSGERGETAIRTQQELYAYRSDEQLKHQQRERKEPNYDVIRNLIESNDFSPQAVITALKVDDELGELFSADAGVFERYTIEQHTGMVLKQFETYHGKTLPEKTRAFFRTLYLLHDIGKPISVQETGDVAKQHEFTMPILKKFLVKLGYDERAIQLADGIINQDYLSNYMKPWGDKNKTIQEIKQRAEILGIAPLSYLEMIKVFYMSDAGAYTADAGGRASLDHLFEFNKDQQTMSFSAVSSDRSPFRGKSPKQYFDELESAVKEL